MLNVGRLLTDHPQYIDLFDQYTIGSPQMFAHTKDIQRIVSKVCAVKLSSHQPGCVACDLRRLGRPGVPQSGNVMGYMSRFSARSSKCYIAVAPARPELDIVDVGTVVYEYINSKWHARDWIKPMQGNAEVLDVAAIKRSKTRHLSERRDWFGRLSEFV